jgi:serine/threonine protein kinase
MATTPRNVGAWVLEGELGRGSFAVVHRAHHSATGQPAAVKEINTDKLNKKLQESLASEVSVLSQTKHRNVVGLLDLLKVGAGAAARRAGGARRVAHALPRPRAARAGARAAGLPAAAPPPMHAQGSACAAQPRPGGGRPWAMHGFGRARRLHAPDTPPLRATPQDGPFIYIVLEYCAGGDLGRYIRRYGRVSEATARYFLAQLAEGLKELRRHNVIHVSRGGPLVWAWRRRSPRSPTCGWGALAAPASR